jgi:hypothetical protein
MVATNDQHAICCISVRYVICTRTWANSVQRPTKISGPMASILSARSVGFDLRYHSDGPAAVPCSSQLISDTIYEWLVYQTNQGGSNNKPLSRVRLRIFLGLTWKSGGLDLVGLTHFMSASAASGERFISQLQLLANYVRLYTINQ